MDTQALRQKIIDLAIRGKLVPQDPNDEPAAALLKRIHTEKLQMVKDGKLKAKDIQGDTVIFNGEDNLHYEKFQDGTVKCIENEIPFEIPDGWIWCRGYSCFWGMESKKPDGKFFEYIDIDSIDNKRHCVLSPKKILSSQAPSRASRKLKNGCIIFSMVRPYLENIAYIDEQLSTCIASTGFYICNPLPLVDAQYLFLLMTSGYIINGLNQFMKGDNSPSIRQKDIENWLYPIPPLYEQKRIVDFANRSLSLNDDITKRINELKSTISITKAKILDLAIRGKLVPQDQNDEPASVLIERIRSEKEKLIKQGKIKRDKNDSVIYKGDDNSYYEKFQDKVICIDDEIPFELPDNWKFIRLKDAWQLLSGRDLSPSKYNSNKDGIPYITGASNFSHGSVSIIRWTQYPQVITKVGDLLITCKGTIGEIAVNDFGDAHIARQIMAIRNTHTLNSGYLRLCIKYYLNLIITSAKGLIPGITREDTLDLILPLPPKQYQIRVVRLIKEIDYIALFQANHIK